MAGELFGPFSGKKHRLWRGGEGQNTAESQPAAWAEVVGQLPLGHLGALDSPWEPFLGSSHACTGGDLGNLLRVLPSHFTDGDTETLEEKDLPEVTWLEGSRSLSPSTSEFPLQGPLTRLSLSLLLLFMMPAILEPTIN